MFRLPSEQIPGVYHRRVGDLTVTAVCDGYLYPPVDIVQGISEAETVQMMVAGQGYPTIRASINVFAIRSEDRTVLVDAGCGSTLGTTCGRLCDNLAKAGIALDSVHAVLLTHIHPDHSNGLTTADGEAVFANAEVIVHEAEIAYWLDDAVMALADERARSRYFAAARFCLAPYRDRIRTFTAGEVLPGIVGLPSHGHTPGHVAYRISSAGEDMLFWGDTVHVPELQVPRPDITVRYDVDQARAAFSRQAIFDILLRDNLVVAGAHLHFPGFARLSRTDGSYRLLPEPWAHTL
ncbi:MBL fold metallo-hydrolase [Paraburkholderia sediminicola]|uniref:MBL fold metallo-hydrolase n=1 Tax=Burkholderiaceae TaxID=119060 RepID=UPI00089B3D62|nr:MBL fold metallo-hydrolase [Burkholderia sp. WP9]SEF14398.1 Glyoxylase, beta-lactamase superfamily II [Burkholderia sp. WP9]